MSLSDFLIKNDVLIEYHGTDRYVTIPDGIVYLCPEAFWGKTALERVRIPDSVTQIDNRAFGNCPHLTEISIPKTVTSIGKEAFACTPWLEARRRENPLVIVNHILIDGQTCQGTAVIPDDVTRIGFSAFSGNTDLTGVVIPESVQEIWIDAFSDTRLTKVVIPESTHLIKYHAFSKCSELREVVFPNHRISAERQIFDDCPRLNKILCHDIAVPAEKYQTDYILELICHRKVSHYLSEAVRYPLLLKMFFLNPEDRELIETIRAYSGLILRFLIRENQTDLMTKLLSFGILVTKENIDKLIVLAIEEKSYEIQLMLMNYKAKHIGYDSDEEIIRRKFAL